MILLLLLTHLSESSPGGEFIKGFLAGFHGTDVKIGDHCLDEAWVEKIEYDALRLLDDLKDKKYFSFVRHVETLASDMILQSNECHLPDIWNILDSINKVGAQQAIYRIFCNLIPIVHELEEASPNNLYTFGFHLARAIKYIEKEDSHLPYLNTDMIASTFEGFLTGIIPQTPGCTTALQAMEVSLQKLLNLTLHYLNGDDVLLPVIQYQSMLVLNDAYQVQMKCQALSILQLLYDSIFTEKGFVKAYLRFGMKYDEIQGLIKEANTKLFEGDFRGYGESWGKITGKIIR